MHNCSCRVRACHVSLIHPSTPPLPLRRCQPVARLRLDSDDVAEEGGDVAAVHWAPPLGRPADLVALGAGCRLLVFQLSGSTASLQVRSDLACDPPWLCKHSAGLPPGCMGRAWGSWRGWAAPT